MRALQALALAAGAASAAAAAQQAAAPAPKPHLIYLLADDYGWANVGFHAADMHTPNIDRMATEEGFELGRLYAYRFCSPTRSALMSGRLPFHVNQNNNAKWGWTEAAVKPSMKMLPEKLQEAGYYTVHAGKWHLGLARQAFTPVGRGFNESLAMLMGSEQHFTQRNGLGPSVQHVDLWASDRPALDQNGTYSANLFGGFGERVLRRHAAINEQQGLAEPLFMYLAYTVTHSPEQAPAEYVDRYPADWVTGRRLYAGMASALDDSVGNITRTLKEVGMWPNTLLIFSSDKCVGATYYLSFHLLSDVMLLPPLVCLTERSSLPPAQRWAIARRRPFQREQLPSEASNSQVPFFRCCPLCVSCWSTMQCP
jgi:arylsulfatase A-like enzyme